MAATLRSELHTAIEMVRSGYGVFKVVVDGETVIDGGASAFLGLMPSRAKVLAAVRERLQAADRATSA